MGRVPDADRPSSNKVKKPKLTPKQAKFVKGVNQGKTKVAAAMEAYPGQSYNVARVTAAENLKKPSIAQAIESAYERQGITVDALVKPIADGLVATKTVIIRDKAATGEEADNSAFVDEVPDHSIRIAAAKLGGQWLGIGKELVPAGGIHFHNHTDSKQNAYSD